MAPANPTEEHVTAKVAAHLLGLSTSQLKRLLIPGRMQAVRVSRGSRAVWMIPRAQVEAEIARRSGTSLASLAGQLGMDRHALWRLVVDLGLAGTLAPGEQVSLNPAQEAAVRAEVERRAEVAAGVLPITLAAARLGLPEGVVQTLARRGELTFGQRPTAARLTSVTLASVEAYERQHAAPPAVTPGEPVVSVADVRHVLGLTRHGVTHLVCARDLAVVCRDRKQYIGVHSIERYLHRHPQPGALERLAACTAACA